MKSRVVNSYSFKLLALTGLAILIAAGAALLLYQYMADSSPSGKTKSSIASSNQINAVYEWRDFRDLEPSAYRQQLKDFRKLGLNTIYLSLDPFVDISDSHDHHKAAAQSQYLQKLFSYATMCKDEGFKVEALAGNSDWSDPEKVYLSRYIISAVAQFNKTYPGVAIHNIQFDIESYNLPQYRDNKSATLRDYLSAVAAIYKWSNQAQAGPLVSVGFAIPFWFDNDTSNVESVLFSGRTRYPLYHLIDMADKNDGFIVVMAYRNQLDGSDGMLAHIKNEVEYASTKNTRLLVAQEVSDVAPAKITYRALGLQKFVDNMNKFYVLHPSRTSFKGIVINDFQSLSQLH